MIDRRAFLSRSGLLMLGAALAPLGTAYAANNGRLVFGVPSGGPGSIGHALGNGALGILGQQFGLHYQLDVVDGRNSLQASESVKLAPPDGLTLLQSQSGSMVLFPAMYKSLKYDPLTDFTPLATLGTYSYALSVGPVVPASVTNIEQYLGWVSKNPDYREVGFSLYGSHGHLIALMLARGKEIALRAQSYKSAPAIFNDFSGNSLAAAITMVGNVPAVGKGLARPLAVSGNARLPAWPHVPTFAEQGLKDIDIQGWYGWFAPAGLPAATAQGLATQINAMAATPAFAELQRRLLIGPLSLSSEQIRQRMRTEIISNQKLVDSYRLSRIV